MTPYANLNEAVSDLRSRGFITTFSIQHDSIHCSELDKEVNPEEITLLEKYQVSDPNNVTGKREVYGIVTADHTKGIMLDTYADYDEDEFYQLFNRFRKPDVE
ncbi:MAG: hypothetical protein LPJ89_00560 [Hymenobacteraceae bacterium]|nr:hypothetical protein [Hymenobacteraceae bacterium]